MKLIHCPKNVMAALLATILAGTLMAPGHCGGQITLDLPVIQSGTNLTLQWPLPTNNLSYWLENSTNLGDTNGWVQEPVYSLIVQLPGASNPSVVASNLPVLGNQYFRLQAMDSASPGSSPLILNQPASQIGRSGNINTTFSVDATARGSGITTVLYQWMAGDGDGYFTDLPNQTNSQLTLDSLEIYDDGSQYCCRLTANGWITFSQVATLKVLSAYGGTVASWGDETNAPVGLSNVV
jgi:hypothetical protein